MKTYGSCLRKQQSLFMVEGDGLVTIPMFATKVSNHFMYISIIGTEEHICGSRIRAEKTRLEPHLIRIRMKGMK